MYSCISNNQKQDTCDSYAHKFHLLEKNQSEIFVSGMSTVLEDTNGCSKKCRCDLAISLMSVISSLYGIIIDLAINTPGHGKNVVYGINAMDKRYLKE